ncbi:3-oxoacyl-ACP synthase III family protein [Hymenobacter norwichensis]|uniref:3-oxoacyl-ACP synthase III family protein n=1 Tax=Hymenobacter norwichensis TaxID=223903 RepID=UPI0003B5538A|nr:ketoacyl-ACP synthase III [Hymenobacter norwichensis]
MIRSVIAATGSCIPEKLLRNEEFLSARFFSKEGAAIEQEPALLLDRFRAITGISARRYALPEQTASDLGMLAAQQALHNSGIDPETLDYLIVAHNFGDVLDGSNRVDQVPSLASRIKARLEIQNPNCVAYDMAFGCPGWVEALIQANYYIRSGDAKRCLVIGTETLSRVVDPHDRDTLLFSDGSGAAVLEARHDGTAGILAHHTQTHAHQYAGLLQMDKSYNPAYSGADRFMKMEGRKLYEFALQHVPGVVKKALDKAQVPLTQIRKVLIHQANEKMDVAILERLFQLCGEGRPDPSLMPMTISWLGNSSVATVPTLMDLLLKGQLDGHQVEPGDHVVLASVGAGMNINAVVYRF